MAKIAAARDLIYTAQSNYNEGRYSDTDRKVHAVIKEVKKNTYSHYEPLRGWVHNGHSNVMLCYYDCFKNAGLFDEPLDVKMLANREENRLAKEAMGAMSPLFHAMPSGLPSSGWAPGRMM